MIQQFLAYAILASLLASFIILLLKKFKVVDYIQIHGSKIISDLFSCDFCLSWWCSILVCGVFSITFGNYQYMFIPFFSTPITRLII
jgi:hypothetical protein